MKITLNGQEKEFKKGQTLTEVVALVCKNTNRVVTEVNGSIVKCAEWPKTSLKEGDRVELVSFVGGG